MGAGRADRRDRGGRRRDRGRRALRRIDGLFSVAGGGGRRFGDGPIHTVTGDAWEATAALNLRTQVLVCAAVVRQMLEQPARAPGRAARSC